MKKVNVYDFDHTIYNGDCSLDFIRFCLRRYPNTWPVISVHIFAALTHAVSGERKQFKEAVFSILKAVPSTAVDSFWNHNKHKIKSWYLDIRRSDDIIISASPEFLLEPMVKTLGAVLIGTRMDPRTGVIDGENCRGVEKVNRLTKYRGDLQIRKFYTDHISDIPLAKMAEESYMVRGNRITAFELQR